MVPLYIPELHHNLHGILYYCVQIGLYGREPGSEWALGIHQLIRKNDCSSSWGGKEEDTIFQESLLRAPQLSVDLHR